MWMLDVFCCALGCVTLLWLLNTRLAGDEKSRATQALADLNATRQTLLATRDTAEITHKALAAEIASLKGRLVTLTQDRDDLSKKYAAVSADLSSTRLALSEEGTKLARQTQAVKARQKELEVLETRLANVEKTREELAKTLELQSVQSADLLAKARSANEKLTGLDARLAILTKENAEANSKLAVLKKASEELTLAKSATSDLQRKIDQAEATIIDLQGQKAKLADRNEKLRMESDTRFAGIAMTGRRVVFVVDMSGSMKLISDKELAPKKWETVVDTIVKVMRSQTDLQMYQVVIFSANAKYLIGNGEWLRYAGESSLKNVRERLMAVDPKGDTNIYDAFDLAFRLKPDGLDTIYFFSDGLPTSGPGFTEEIAATMNNAQRTEHLTRQLKQALTAKWNTGERRVKINSIGFFYESPEVGAFLWALSRDNDGSFVGMSRP